MINIQDIHKCIPPDLPYSLGEHASVVSDKGIISCGGYNRTIQSACTIQTATGETRSFPSMVSPHSNLGMVIIKDVIYAIGGFPTDNKMETINIKKKRKWTRRILPFHVYSHCVVSINNTIIVIGGLGTTRIRNVRTYEVSSRIGCFMEQIEEKLNNLKNEDKVYVKETAKIFFN